MADFIVVPRSEVPAFQQINKLLNKQGISLLPMPSADFSEYYLKEAIKTSANSRGLYRAAQEVLGRMNTKTVTRENISNPAKERDETGSTPDWLGKQS